MSDIKALEDYTEIQSDEQLIEKLSCFNITAEVIANGLSLLEDVEPPNLNTIAKKVNRRKQPYKKIPILKLSEAG
ncbi:MAG: hypothetical protein JEY97_06905 [Bacteroidales bacterium]|nr:hypothetical protein [Bacteroidales bacterium]